MATCAYPIYRAIGRPIVFNQYQGQYILYGAVCLIGDLLLFIFLYLCHVPPWFCIALAFTLGGIALTVTAWLSKQFGTDGLRKWSTARRLPHTIRYASRRNLFTILKTTDHANKA